MEPIEGAMSKFSGWTLEALRQRRQILNEVYRDHHKEVLSAQANEAEAQFKLIRLRQIEGFLNEDMEALATALTEEEEKNGIAH